MASSRRKPSKTRRRFVWLLIAIVAVIALYTFGWFYAADRLVNEANAALGRLANGGNRATCENMEARGYPFRIGLFCDSVFFEQRGNGMAFDAGAFRSAGQVYAPLRIVAELDSPVRAELPQFLPLNFRWQTMQASARLAMPLPERLSIVASTIVADVDTPGAGVTGLFEAQEVQLHLRPDEADLDTGLRFSELQAGPFLAGLDLPPISGVGDIGIVDGLRRIETRDFALPGTQLDIRRLELSIEDGGTLTARGPLTIGEDGLIDANLELRSSDAAAFLAVLAGSLPEIRPQLVALGAGLGALGPGQPLPLTIRDGVATFGFIELGRIPPL